MFQENASWAQIQVDHILLTCINNFTLDTNNVDLFATCNGSAATQNVLQLVEVLNEGKCLLHKMLSVDVPYRRHCQLNANVILTHDIWIWSSISITNARQTVNTKSTIFAFCKHYNHVGNHNKFFCCWILILSTSISNSINIKKSSVN